MIQIRITPLGLAMLILWFLVAWRGNPRQPEGRKPRPSKPTPSPAPPAFHTKGTVEEINARGDARVRAIVEPAAAQYEAFRRRMEELYRE